MLSVAPSRYSGAHDALSLPLPSIQCLMLRNPDPLDSQLSAARDALGLPIQSSTHVSITRPPAFLYSQLSAARDALGLPIHVSISGQAEAAEALSEAAEAEPLAPPLEQQGASSSAGPAGAELATKKRKLTSAQSDTYKVGTSTWEIISRLSPGMGRVKEVLVNNQGAVLCHSPSPPFLASLICPSSIVFLSLTFFSLTCPPPSFPCRHIPCPSSSRSIRAKQQQQKQRQQPAHRLPPFLAPPLPNPLFSSPSDSST